MVVNNGNFRRTEFIIEKVINGQSVFTDGFPIVLSLLQPFAQYPALTQDEFSLLSDLDYQVRLTAFYTYVSLQYPVFNSSEHIPTDPAEVSNGTDLDACPLSLGPSFRPTLKLFALFYDLGSGIREAEVFVGSVDSSGSPVNVASAVTVSYLLKQAGPGTLPVWDSINGEILTAEIPASQSQALLVPRFRFKGASSDTIVYKSVFVQLYSGEISGEYLSVEPTKISITVNDSAFLTSFISNLQTSAQAQLTLAQIQEIADSKLGEITTGKSTHKFTFQQNIPQRPVYIYPASWGLLNQILYTQGFNADILAGGAFHQHQEITLNVNGASVNYLIYSAMNLIIYQNKADYQFLFSGS